MYQLINGKEVAEKIKLQVKEEIKSLGKDVTLAVVIGGLLYAFLTVKFGLAQKIIGPKVDRVLEKLHIRV